MVRTFGSVLIACALASTPAPGQVSSEAPPETPADSLAQAAASGRSAAGEPAVGGYFIAPFVAGIPLGFVGPFALLGDPTVLAIAGGGVAVIAITTSRARDRDIDLPVRLRRDLDQASPAYREAFRAAYAERLSRRRFRASLWGAGVGTAAGFGTLVWAVSQLGDF